MDKNFFDLLEKKLYWAERRYRIAQKDLWLYRQILERSGHKPKKKIEQLELFANGLFN